MKTGSHISLLAAAIMVGVCGAAHAGVIFTDTFDSGTGDWYKAGTTNTLSNNGAGQLAWSGREGDNHSIREAIGRSFPTESLPVGYTIRLTLDYTQSSTAVGNIFRVGLYDVQNPIDADGWSTTSGELIGTFSGYTGFFRDVGTPNPLRTDSGTDTTSVTTGPAYGGTAFATLSGDNTSYDIAANTQYQVVFELTRVSLTQVDGLFTLSSGSTIHQSLAGSTPIVQNEFDTVVLRSVNPVLFDNIQLTVIPEPGTASLIAMLAAAAFLQRRLQRR